MQIFPFIVVAWILAVGLYGIVTSRHLIHLIVCLIIVQSSTYVLLLAVGYVTGAVSSSGTIALISFFVGLEVAAAFILIVGELLEQTLLIRHGSG